MGSKSSKGVTGAVWLGLVLGLAGCVGQVDGMGDRASSTPTPPGVDGGGGDIPTEDGGTMPPTPPMDMAPGPEAELPSGNNGIRLVPTSEVASSGVIDPVSSSYQYAPEMMYVDGTYYFWDCWGVAGDYIGFKSGPTLESLGAQPMGTALMPVGDENHTCDPSVVKGADGHYYLHYSYLPNGYATWAAVAVSDSPAGPWWRLGPTVGSPSSNELNPGAYGRGQTSVTRGFDGAYYMLFTNQIEPKEPNGIILVRSPDASFRTGMQEVARFTGPELAGWSVDMAYDPASRHFLMTVPGPGGLRITTVNTSFQIDGAIVLGANAIHKESQTFVTNEYGELIRPNGQFTIVSGQPGPRDNDWATSPATGPIFWEKHNVSLSGVLGAQNFESGNSDGWVSYAGANIANYEAANAVSGSRVMAFNAGAGSGSIQRDHGIEITPGSAWLATARVTAETATAAGTYCLWFLGVTGNESACVPYSVKNGEWTTVTVIGHPNGPHNVLRAEFYPGAGTTRVDNTRTEALVSAQTFESGSGEGWSIYPNTTGNMVNYDVTSSYGGARLLAFNSGTGDGSVLNDLAITVNAGSTFSTSAMLRSQGGKATGSYCLWLLGDSANENVCAPYTVNDLGWTRLDISVAATGRHTLARVQFYPDEGTTFIDNVILR